MSNQHDGYIDQLEIEQLVPQELPRRQPKGVTTKSKMTVDLRYILVAFIIYLAFFSKGMMTGKSKHISIISHNETIENPLSFISASPSVQPLQSSPIGEPNSTPQIERQTPKPTHSPTVDIHIKLEAPVLKEQPTKQDLIEKWGAWHFWDSEADIRPDKESYILDSLRNKDFISYDLDNDAWQNSAVYVNHFLDSAEELVERAKDAILAEYGHPKEDGMSPVAAVARHQLFSLKVLGDTDDELQEPELEVMERGGWTTKKSLSALSRRILHAMVTMDTFTIVMGGYSTSAACGNQFSQNYMMQLDKILRPIFELMRIDLVVHDMSKSGMGTLQDTLGGKSIYGEDIDILIWDSSATDDKTMMDFFATQALMSKKPPLLMGMGGYFDILKELHLTVDADVIGLGTGMGGIPLSKDQKQTETLPWAVQYLKCDSNSKKLCDNVSSTFDTTCWINERDPRDSSFQGWRDHQLKSRIIMFAVLEGLDTALGNWMQSSIENGAPLPDEEWHMTEHYDNIRTKASSLDDNNAECNELTKFFPKRVCKIPLNARTEFTPRLDPDETGIMSILRDSSKIKTKKSGHYVPENVISEISIPDGEIDIFTIISNVNLPKSKEFRRRMVKNSSHELLHGYTSRKSNREEAERITQPFLSPRYKKKLGDGNDSIISHSSLLRRKITSGSSIVAGDGWRVHGERLGICDGTLTGVCGNDPTSECSLFGHHDSRGGIIGDALSGWLVMDIPNVLDGIIIVKMETSHKKLKNNKKGEERDRKLGDPLPQLPDNFIFEFSINGKIESWDKNTFMTQRKLGQDNVELFTLMDDTEISKSGQVEKIELAIQLKGCGEDCIIKLTHVYWA